METLLSISLGLAAVSLLLTLITHVAVAVVRRRPASALSGPGISVLKPLKGVDDELYENLASFARQDYPEFELLFGAEDPRDPALAIVERIRREFPNVRIRVFAGAPSVGLNPKVNNLRMLAQRAAHDAILISDSNVRARSGYLTAMAAELGDPSVGLVSSVIVGHGEQSLGARLDNLHMNSFVVRAVCGADVLISHPCVVGKSMLLCASDLERLGGLGLVDNVLAEDYVLGRAFSDAGFRVALSPHAILSVGVHRSVGAFAARHLRWCQMRRRLSPAAYLLEPLQSPVPWLLLALALILAGAPAPLPNLVPILVGGLFLRLASDAAIVRELRGVRLALRDYAAIVLKDVVFIGIWVLGGVKSRVRWRGTILRIGAKSRLFPVENAAREYEALETPG